MSEREPCDLSLEDLVAHLDGELGESASARVRVHLAECVSCAREADLLARAGAALEALPGTRPGADFTERVLAATRAPQPGATRRGRLLRLWPAAAVAAALLAAFLLGRGTPEPEPTDGGEVAQELTDEELEAIARDLPLLAALEALQNEDDAENLIALIENLDLLESVETQSLDVLDDLVADGENGG